LFFPFFSFLLQCLPSCYLPDHILRHTYNQHDSNFRIPVFCDMMLRRCVSVYEPAEGTYFLRHPPKYLNQHLQRSQTFKTRKREICFKRIIPYAA
jgi:hypothetical protein